MPSIQTPQPQAWVYMMRCKNGSLYTGWTNDLAGRVAAHQQGRGAKYTRAFGALELAWAEPQPDKAAALRREAAVKKLSKAEKEALAAAWAETVHSLCAENDRNGAEAVEPFAAGSLPLKSI